MVPAEGSSDELRKPQYPARMGRPSRTSPAVGSEHAGGPFLRMKGPLSFFPNDRAKDVDPLTMEERGMYFTVMRHQWPNGGPIPKDELDRLIEKPWLSTRDVFRRRFEETDTSISLLWVEEEREKRTLFSEQQSAKGRLGGRPTKGKKLKKTHSLTENKPGESPRVGKGIRSGMGNGIGSEQMFEAEIEPTFNQWFDLYDKRKAKGECEAKWKMIPQATREAIMVHTSRLVMTTPKEYRKDPIRYLTKNGWEDEIVERTTAPKFKTNDQYRDEVIRAAEERFGNR